jgi:general secretion pathway protein G
MQLFKQKGFTLIELLVVISIVSLLSSVVATGLTSARAKARDSKRIQELIQMRNALELYRTDNNDYPLPNDGIGDQFQSYSIHDKWKNTNGASGNFPAQLSPYLSKLPVDPINNDVPGFGSGAHFYWYYKYSTGYVLCAALESPKTSTFNPLASFPQFGAFPADHGDSQHMFYNGFCVSSF